LAPFVAAKLTINLSLKRQRKAIGLAIQHFFHSQPLWRGFGQDLLLFHGFYCHRFWHTIGLVVL
jgi:hypothetical protein